MIEMSCACTMLAGHRWGPPLSRNTLHQVPSEQHSIPYQPAREAGREEEEEEGEEKVVTTECGATIGKIPKGCLLQGGLRLGLGGGAMGGAMGGAKGKARAILS